MVEEPPPPAPPVREELPAAPELDAAVPDVVEAAEGSTPEQAVSAKKTGTQRTRARMTLR